MTARTTKVQVTGITVGVMALCCVLAGCSDAVSESQAVSPSALETAAPVVTPSSSPTVSAAATEEEETQASLTDLNGRWCPTSPAEWGEQCLTVDLPVVSRDGSTAAEYVYLDSIAGDPTAATLETYEVPADLGDCWSATVDGYPSSSGAALMFCPSMAVSGETWIDDPASAADFFAVEPTEVPDYRELDRLYISQEVSIYPYIREGA